MAIPGCGGAPPSVHIPLRRPEQATVPKEHRGCLLTVRSTTLGAGHRHTTFHTKGASPCRAMERASKSLWLLHTNGQEVPLTSCRMGKHTFCQADSCIPTRLWVHLTLSVPCSPDTQSKKGSHLDSAPSPHFSLFSTSWSMLGNGSLVY